MLLFEESEFFADARGAGAADEFGGDVGGGGLEVRNLGEDVGDDVGFHEGEDFDDHFVVHAAEDGSGLSGFHGGVGAGEGFEVRLFGFGEGDDGAVDFVAEGSDEVAEVFEFGFFGLEALGVGVEVAFALFEGFALALEFFGEVGHLESPEVPVPRGETDALGIFGGGVPDFVPTVLEAEEHGEHTEEHGDACC